MIFPDDVRILKDRFDITNDKLALTPSEDAEKLVMSAFYETCRRLE